MIIFFNLIRSDLPFGSNIYQYDLVKIFESKINKINPNYISSIVFSVKKNEQIKIYGLRKNVLKVLGFNSNLNVLAKYKIGKNKNRLRKKIINPYNTGFNSFIILKEFNSIFVVNNYLKSLIQYELTGKNGYSKILKKYGNFYSGNMTAFANFGSLLFIGGTNYLVKVINVQKRFAYDFRIVTPVEMIESLTICLVNGESNELPSKVFLVVVGSESTISKNKTNVFDITEFCLQESSGNFKNIWENKIKEEELKIKIF